MDEHVEAALMEAGARINALVANERRLIDELAALRKDAERYRWLRDVASGGDWEQIGQTTDPTNTDARIDECMAAYKAFGAA